MYFCRKCGYAWSDENIKSCNNQRCQNYKIMPEEIYEMPQQVSVSQPQHNPQPRQPVEQQMRFEPLRPQMPEPERERTEQRREEMQERQQIFEQQRRQTPEPQREEMQERRQMFEPQRHAEPQMRVEPFREQMPERQQMPEQQRQQNSEPQMRFEPLRPQMPERQPEQPVRRNPEPQQPIEQIRVEPLRQQMPEPLTQHDLLMFGDTKNENCVMPDIPCNDDLPLAFATVPFQRDGSMLYPPREALMAGTIFTQLEMPWKQRIRRK